MPALQLGFDFTATAPSSAGGQPTSEHVREPATSETSDALPPPERIAALAYVLRSRSQLPVELTITDNRRTMLSVRRGPALIEVRLHHMFVQGDAELWAGLADYLFSQDRSAAQCIARYVAQHREQIRRIPKVTAAPPNARARGHVRRPAAGLHHDLDEIFHAVNARYFDGGVDAQIAWARARAARVSASGEAHATPHASTVRRSIKLGSYNSRDRMIRVHPALDAAFVPRFFVEYIVYHEMLHQIVPPEVQDGRREMHSALFKARERDFEDYRAALAWERDNLARLLRTRGARRRRSNRSTL
jgi:hypothetical protein